MYSAKLTLAELKATPPSEGIVLYDRAIWSWATGDFTGQADDVDVVKADSTTMMRGDYGIIAAITDAIARRLQDAVSGIKGPISQTLVTARRPVAIEVGAPPQINVYLFHVLPNPYLRNVSEPWMVGGRTVDEPTTALDLLYLITFSGAEDIGRLQPQQLLGITANTLTVEAAIETDAFHRSLDSIGTVVLTPYSMSVEEMSRLWAMFPNVPYQLSICYRASAALIVASLALHRRPDPPRRVAPHVERGARPPIAAEPTA